MRCPFCGEQDGRVVDSRTSKEGDSIRRRRECLNCSKRFTTYERIEEAPLQVIKKDGTRAPFDREKIRHGIQRACEKRPVSAAQIDEIVSSIENEISKKYDREVPTRILGELIMDRLIQPHLGFGRPIFVHNYPAGQASLAKIAEGNGLTAERFEVFINGIEIANGYVELTEAEELERSCGIAPSDLVVSIIENTDEDWSFGLGRAQFLTGDL